MHRRHSIHATRKKNGLPIIQTWEDMKNEMTLRYVLLNYQQGLSERIAACTQAEYSDEFHTLGNRAHLMKTKLIIVERYKRGLRKPIRDL